MSWRQHALVGVYHQCLIKCGGTFTCEGCKRIVGWCFGAADDLGYEHCDDCYCDRLAILQRIKVGCGIRFQLAMGAKRNKWMRPPPVVAAELVEDGFLVLKRNGRFYLTASARELIS